MSAGGGRIEEWESRIRASHPDLLSHLVWSPDRLRSLERVVGEVLRQDRVPEQWFPVGLRAVMNRITGLGPLNPLLLDEEIDDILVNGPDAVFCERGGDLYPVDMRFSGNEEVMLFAQRLANRAGRTLTSENPLCDAQLSDGSRVHCAIPPVAAEPSITIRKKRNRALGLEEFLRMGTFSREIWDELSGMVAQKCNFLIAGGAGSGKTSLLRLLAGSIRPAERLIVIEDVRELDLAHPNLVSLEAHRITIRELLKNALRMRPDRLVVGEVRGPEALDLLEAMASGHPGSFATIHCRGGGLDAVHRMARLAVRASTGMAFGEMVEQILSTLDVIIHLERGPDGCRRISAIDRVVGDAMVPLWRLRFEKEAFVGWERGGADGD